MYYEIVRGAGHGLSWRSGVAELVSKEVEGEIDLSGAVQLSGGEYMLQAAV